jgi:hypothetical protein
MLADSDRLILKPYDSDSRSDSDSHIFEGSARLVKILPFALPALYTVIVLIGWLFGEQPGLGDFFLGLLAAAGIGLAAAFFWHRVMGVLILITIFIAVWNFS